MMDELKEVKRVLNPTEVLLVVDAMTGQEAAGIHIQLFKVLIKTSTKIKHVNMIYLQSHVHI